MQLPMPDWGMTLLTQTVGKFGEYCGNRC